MKTKITGMALAIALALCSCTTSHISRVYAGFCRAILEDTTGGIHTYKTARDGIILKFKKLPNDTATLTIGKPYYVQPISAFQFQAIK